MACSWSGQLAPGKPACKATDRLPVPALVLIVLQCCLGQAGGSALSDPSDRAQFTELSLHSSCNAMRTTAEHFKVQADGEVPPADWVDSDDDSFDSSTEEELVSCAAWL